MKKTTDNTLVYSIIGAAILIAVALAYAGYEIAKVNKSDNGLALEQQVQQGVQDYMAKQEATAAKAKEEANKPQRVENVSTDDDAFLGDANAPVTIVEFSDYDCPFCERHFQQTYPLLKENYIDTGKVKYVFRDFPLTQLHPNSFASALAAECAGDQDKYFEMHDLLFANQSAHTTEDIQGYAEQIGLDMPTFNTCVANKTHYDEIENDMKDAQSYGVTGTPSFFINGWNLSGAYPYSEFEKLIEQELNK